MQKGAPPARMQPNPVYAELTPSAPPRQKKKGATPPKKKVAAKRGERRRDRGTTTAPPASEAGPGGRLSVELSLAAAPTSRNSCIEPNRTGPSRTAGMFRGGHAMDALADIRQPQI